MTYKRILCATDFSETSIEAIRAANDLARAFQSELLLVHVVEPVPPSPDILEEPHFDVAVYEKAWKEDAQRQLKSVVGRYIDATVPNRAIVLSGRAAQMIDKCAMDEKADLIVVATHGMTGWRHYLMGSVAQKVIHYTSLPVLVVRGAAGAAAMPGVE